MQGDRSTVARLVFALILLVTAVAQSTVLPAINFLGVSPNLVLVLIVIWSNFYGAREGVVWAFFAGVMIDVLAVGALGSTSLALIPVALIGGLARRPLLQSGLVLPMILVVAATLASILVLAIVGAIAGQGYPFLVSVRLGLLTALLNTMMVPPLYLILAFLDRVGVRGVAQA
jgi:rod shape-determining protein MreD